jgi:hypothetical protein
MNLEQLQALFDSTVENLPDSVSAEMKADLNHLAQELKHNKCTTVEELKLKADYLTDEFKMKHGANGSK